MEKESREHSIFIKKQKKKWDSGTVQETRKRVLAVSAEQEMDNRRDNAESGGSRSGVGGLLLFCCSTKWIEMFQGIGKTERTKKKDETKKEEKKNKKESWLFWFLNYFFFFE